MAWLETDRHGRLRIGFIVAAMADAGVGKSRLLFEFKFSRGALYQLLANPLYIGEIRHKQERHPGQHEAILPRALWEDVQQRLEQNAARGRRSSNQSIASPLAGKLFDSEGQALYVQGATKGRRRYRYYVSKCLVNGLDGDSRKGGRLPAPELERAVAIAARCILSDRAAMLEALEQSGIESPDVRATLEWVSNLSRRLQDESNAIAALGEIVNRVELRGDGISVTLRIEVLCSHADVRTTSTLGLLRFVALRMKRRGVETRIVIAAGEDLRRNMDPALLKAVARSRVWFEELASGNVRSFAEIARRQKMTRRYVERLSRLAFTAPAVVEAICQGRQPAELSAETLLKRIDLPVEWPLQLKAVGLD